MPLVLFRSSRHVMPGNQARTTEMGHCTVEGLRTILLRSPIPVQLLVHDGGHGASV